MPPDVRQQLEALDEVGLLHSAISCGMYRSKGWADQAMQLLDGLLGTCLRDRTGARRLAGPMSYRVRSCLWAEVLRQGCRFPKPKDFDTWIQAVDRAAARTVTRATRLVFGREDACLASFAAAQAVGALRLYDLPVPFYRTMWQVLATECREFPQAVASGFSLPETFAPRRRQRKDQELASADRVIVASRFVFDSLRREGYPAERITVLPYGCEPDEALTPKGDSRANNKVVLYIGHLSLRKGTPRLLRVWKRLGAHRTHQLRLIGQQQLPEPFLAEYTGLFEHIPPLPRKDLWPHFGSASFFVFPSAADGFGLVLNEAMSCGLPVVASTHTGAPGFITHGQEGLIYTFGDDDALAAALDHMLSRPDEVERMGRAALRRAHAWTWTEYRQGFRNMILSLLARAR
jgi:alpha-maltose-1-phosphate synthase